MGRNFQRLGENGQTLGNAQPQHRIKPRGPAAPLAFRIALAAGAALAASTISQEAQAQEGATIEFKELNIRTKATVLDGVLIVNVSDGGWFSSNEAVLRIPLKGRFTELELARMHGEEVEVKLEGETEGGVFRGKITIETPFQIGGPISLDSIAAKASGAGCTISGPCPRRSSSAEGKGGRNLSPEPGRASAESVERNTALVKPLDPGTFYVTDPSTVRRMGEGQPNGFEMMQGRTLTFLVTGEDSGDTVINLELYPWVSTDAAKRNAMLALQASVGLDGERADTPPQTLPNGKPLETSKTGSGDTEIVLWGTPTKIPVKIPRGTHEVVVSSPNGSYRVVVRGALETRASEVEPAIEHPFEEDPNFPPVVEFAGRLRTNGDEPSGLKLEPITPNPLQGMTVKITRLANDTRASVQLTLGDKGKKDYVVYETADPLEPDTDYMLRFKRVSPPGESTDPTGPAKIAVDIDVTGTEAAGFDADVKGKPTGLTCQVNNVRGAAPAQANVHCWETDMRSRVRAYQARLDTRPTNPDSKPRRHILRRAP